MYKQGQTPHQKPRWRITIALTVLLMQFLTPFSLLIPEKALAGPGTKYDTVTALFNYQVHRTSVDYSTIEMRQYSRYDANNIIPADLRPAYSGFYTDVFKYDRSKKRYIAQYNNQFSQDFSKCMYIETDGANGYGGKKGKLVDNCHYYYTNSTPVTIDGINIVNGVAATYVTADVVDHNHFKVGSTTYYDGKTDDDVTYNGPDGCDGTDKILSFYNSENANDPNATKKVYGADPNNVTNNPAAYLMTSRVKSSTDTHCNYTILPVTFTHPENYRVYWLWKDAGTIGSSDGDRAYKSDESNPLRFIENTDNQCKSYIDVPTIGADTGKWVIRNDNVHDGWPNVNAENHTCTTSNGHDMKIGDIANARKPRGSSAFNGSAGGGTAKAQCDAGWLTWIICPVLDLASQAYATLEGWVGNAMVMPALTQSNYSGAYAVWLVLQKIAYSIFVLIFVISIFATTTSFGPDSYTVKKVLPKLVISALLIAFSWVLMSLAIDVSNVLGLGIQAVFESLKLIPQSSGHTLSAGFKAVDFGIGFLGTGLLIAFAPALILPVLLAVIGLVIGIVQVFITIQIRQFIILMLVIVSPLAILAWVLPNTESMFKTWYKMLTRLLLMFPIMMFIFSAAHLGYGVVHDSSSDSFANNITGVILPIIAFYMVPWTFKWAGGAMTMAAGFIAGRASKLSGAASSPLSDRYKQARATSKANSAANRQLKAGMDFGKGGIKGLRAQIRTGNFGSRGKARLAAAGESAKQEQVKAERAKLLSEMDGMDVKAQAVHMETAKNSSNEQTREAAYKIMWDKGMLGDTDDGAGNIIARGLISTIGSRSTADNTKDIAWQRTMADNYKEINEKAGLLLKDGADLKERVNKFAGSTKASQLSTTKQDVLDVINKNLGSVGTTERANLHLQAQEVVTSPRLRTGVGPDETALLSGF